MMRALLVAMLLQAAAAPEPEDIVVVAHAHRCGVAIANHVLSDPEFRARLREYAAGTPVRVVAPRDADPHCLIRIMFRLARHGVTNAVFVDR